MTKFDSRTLLRSRMSPYISVVIVAMLLTLVLALVGALIGTIVGPSFKILTSSEVNAGYSLVSLFGESIGPFVSALSGQNQITRSELISYLPFVLVVLAGIKTLFFLCQWYLWEVTGEKISMTIRSEMFSGFLCVDPQFLDSVEGESYASMLASGMSVDIKYLKEYVVRVYGGMPRELLQAIFLGWTLFLLSSRLFFIFFLGLIPVILIIRRLGKIIQKRAGTALEDFSALTEWLQQRLLGVETIKHYRTEFIEVVKLKELTANLLYRFYKSARAKAKASPVIEISSIAAVGAVIYVSLMDVEIGAVSGSVVMSFLTTLALMGQSLSRFGRYYNSNREASAAVLRIASLLQTADTHSLKDLGLQVHQTLSDAEVIEGLSVHLECVTINYSGRAKGLLNFSGVFDAGKVYCICGSSGAGKSTLVNVILGLIQPSQGNAFISMPRGTGNFDQSVGGSSSIKSNSGGGMGLETIYVPQSIILMPGSIAENLAYPSLSVDLGRVENALNSVGLAKFVGSLKYGVNTIVGQGGQTLSGGQSQRLYLARLWYHRPAIVVVDEGTSALDLQNEQLIHRGLRNLADQGSVVIMIAHRLGALEVADEVVLLREGGVAISGDCASVVRSDVFAEYLGSAAR